jgi:hypothetical protein
MSQITEHRPVDSPYLKSISRLRFTEAGHVPMQPDGCWDIAILKRGDDARVLRTGLTTRSVTYEHGEGDEILILSFQPHTFMPLMPGEMMRDQGVLLDRFGRRDFWLGPQVREIPDFENADVFVAHLVRDGVIESNDVVASVVEGHPKAMSERTLQRHFLKTTGLTYKHFTLVKRAQQAAVLLQMGRSAADVALALGYYDQAHMINSVREIMGQTPGRIAARESVGNFQ